MIAVFAFSGPTTANTMPSLSQLPRPFLGWLPDERNGFRGSRTSAAVRNMELGADRSFHVRIRSWFCILHDRVFLSVFQSPPQRNNTPSLLQLPRRWGCWMCVQCDALRGLVELPLPFEVRGSELPAQAIAEAVRGRIAHTQMEHASCVRKEVS